MRMIVSRNETFFLETRLIASLQNFPKGIWHLSDMADKARSVKESEKKLHRVLYAIYVIFLDIHISTVYHIFS